MPDAGWLGPLMRSTMTREPGDRWSMSRVRDVLTAGPSATTLASVPTPAPTQPDPTQPDPTPTRMLSRPAAVAPVLPRGSGRDRLLPVLAAVLGVIAIAVIGWVALTAGTDGGGDTTGPGAGSAHQGSPGDSGNPSDSGSPSDGGAPDGVTADGMENFIEDYLATVTSDPKAAWPMLTPGFQDASGGFGQYKSFWKTIETADVLSAQADPADRRITYTVEYLRRDGSKITDDVTLLLEGTDGEYLISAEP